MKKKYLTCLIFLAVGSLFASSALLAQVPKSDLWKNKILYAGGSAGLGPIMGNAGIALGGNINPLQLDWQMTRFLALGSGFDLYLAPKTKHTALKQTDPGSGIMETYVGMEARMLFPLQLRLTFRPGVFSFELGGGIYAAPVRIITMVERTNDNGYTVSESYGKNLFSAERSNPFGFIASGSFGFKAGQGILFLDVGYLRDFSEVTIKFNDEKIGKHLWNMLAINIGYKYGFFNRGT